jgi:hypothetical protein
MTTRELEILTINKYFQKDKATRYADFVSKDKTRMKFISVLAQLKDLKYSMFEKLNRNEKDHVLRRAYQQRLDTCYVISENTRIDRHFMAIEQALDETIGRGMGTLLILGPAKIVYYEGEAMEGRWISL